MTFYGQYFLQLLFLRGFLLTFSLAYNDIELKCKSGHRVASFSREGGAGVNVTRLTIECAPLSHDTASIKDVKCQENKPISCNTKTQGCKDPNTWIGGYNQFQIDPNIPVDILVPICCSASNVEVVSSQCVDKILNFYHSSINYTLNAGYITNLMTCWTLADTKNVVMLGDRINRRAICMKRGVNKIFSQLLLSAISTTRSYGVFVDGKFAVEEKKATTPIVKQALIAATDFPNHPAATVFDDENDIKVTDPPESSRDKNANCPPCVCQCPSFQCPDNLRAIKRLVRQKRGNCICHCLCDYRCA